MTELTLFFIMTLCINTNLLGFWYLFHCVDVLGLFILDFPHTSEPSWADLIDEVVGITSKFTLWLFHHDGSWNWGVFLCSKKSDIEILFHQLFWRFHFYGRWVFRCVYCWFDFFGECVSLWCSCDKIFLVHINIRVQFYDVSIHDLLETNGRICGWYFLYAFSLSWRFLCCSIHFLINTQIENKSKSRI